MNGCRFNDLNGVPFAGLWARLVVSICGLSLAEHSSGLEEVGCTPQFDQQVLEARIPETRGTVFVDLDGDSALDIVVSSHASANVSILFGNGQGQFEPPLPVPLEQLLDPHSLHDFAVADLNGDGGPDLAVPNAKSGGLFILLNQGEGKFEPPFFRQQVGKAPHDAKAGDFNRDGLPDLAVANAGNDTVSVLLNTGGGAFSAPVKFPTGDRPRTLALGDFNNDRRLDIATANRLSHDVTVLLGNGNGGFAAATSFPTGQLEPRSVLTADVDQDGDLDFVVTHRLASQNLVLLQGDGTGHFGPPRSFQTGRESRGITAGDFNGDGILDVAVGNIKPDSVSLLLGDIGASEFTFLPTPPINARGPTDLATGDVNGDGWVDLVATIGKRTQVTLLVNRGC